MQENDKGRRKKPTTRRRRKNLNEQDMHFALHDFVEKRSKKIRETKKKMANAYRCTHVDSRKTLK